MTDPVVMDTEVHLRREEKRQRALERYEDYVDAQTRTRLWFSRDILAEAMSELSSNDFEALVHAYETQDMSTFGKVAHRAVMEMIRSYVENDTRLDDFED